MRPVTASLSPTDSPRGPLFPRAPCSPFSPICPCKGFQKHRGGFYQPPQAQLISKSIFYYLLSRHEVRLVPLGPGTWSRRQRQVKGCTELLSSLALSWPSILTSSPRSPLSPLFPGGPCSPCHNKDIQTSQTSRLRLMDVTQFCLFFMLPEVPVGHTSQVFLVHHPGQDLPKTKTSTTIIHIF